MSDRYGLAATFSFEVAANTMQTMSALPGHLQNIENSVKSLSRTVGSSQIGMGLQQQFRQGNAAMQAAQSSTVKTQQGFANLAHQLRPVRDEFRALRSEARNITFGDLDDPTQFDGAKAGIERYIKSLQHLETQITGTSAVERTLVADLKSQQRIAGSKIEQATAQRSAATASQKVGKGQAIAAAGAAVTVPLIGLGVSTVKLTSDFDDKMRQIAAVTDDADRTVKNMEAIRQKAKEIGAATKFSASDAAEGFNYLAQAGFKVEQQMQAITGTVSLAAAGNLDLGRATEIVVSGLGQFNLKADQANRLSDILAVTAGKTQTDVGQLGDALKYVGGAANAFKATPEQAIAVLGGLSEVGLTGEQGGTAGRAVFQRLANPSAKAQGVMDGLNVSATDSAGNYRSIIEILKDLDKATSKLTEGNRGKALGQIFGTEAVSGALGLMQRATSGMLDSTTGLNNAAAGAAKKQQDLLEGGIGGSFRNLSSAWEGVLLELGEQLIPVLVVITNGISALLSGFIALPGPIKSVVAGVIVAAAVLGSLAIVVGTATAAMGGLQLAVAQSSLATGILSKTVLPLTGYFQTAITAIGSGGFAGVVTSASGAIGGLSAAAATLGQVVAGGLATAVGLATSPIGLMVGAAIALYGVLEILTPGINILGNVLSAVAAPIGFVLGLVTGLAKGIYEGLKPAIDALTIAFSPLSTAVSSTFGGINEAIGMATAAFQSMFGTGEQLGMLLGQVIVAPFSAVVSAIGAAIKLVQIFGSIVAAPFQIASDAVTGVLNYLYGIWGGFIGWLTDSLMAIPNAVSSAFNKILPPFLKKDDKENNSPAAIGSNPPPPPSSPPNPFSAAKQAVSNILPFSQAPLPVVKNNLSINKQDDSKLAMQAVITPVVDQSALPSQLQSLSGGVGQFGLPLAIAPTIQPFADQLTAQAAAAGQAVSGKFNELLNFTPKVDRKPVEVLGEAISSVGTQFKAAASGAFWLGVASLTSLSPVILVVGALALGVIAIAANFLGIRTIVKGVGQMIGGVFTTVRGAIELVIGLLQSTLNLGKGMLQVLGGLPRILIGDFSGIKKGFQTMQSALIGGSESVRKALTRMGSGVSLIFKGASNVVRGLTQAVEQTVKGSVLAIKSVPMAVGGMVKIVKGLWQGAQSVISAVRLVPQALGGLKELPAKVQAKLSQITDRFDAAKNMIRSIWNAIELRLPEINLSAIKELPAKIGSFLIQITDRFDATKDMIRSIWNAIELRLPEVNFASVLEIPSKVGGLVDQARNAWSKLQMRLPEIDLSGFMVIPERIRGFIAEAVQVVQAGIEKIGALWEGLSGKFKGVMGFMGDAAKKAGKGFIRDLSENSPGPTFQIRTKWQFTTESIAANLIGLKQEAATAGRAMAAQIGSGASEAATKAKSKLTGLKATMHGLKASKGAGALGRSSSAIGMALSNISPQLAMPLFAMSDMIDTTQTLSESFPQLQKSFTNLKPALGQLQGKFTTLLPLMRSGLVNAASAGRSAFIAFIPVAQAFGAQMIVMIPIVIAQLGAMATAFMGMASVAIAAIIPIVLPFLPIVAAVGAVIGVVALLKTAFDNNFLGIAGVIYGVGDSIKYGLTFPFRMAAQAGNFAVNQIKSLLGNLISWIYQKFVAMPAAVGGAIYQLINSLGTSFFNLINPLQLVGNLAQFVMSALGGAATWVTGAWQGFSGWFGGAMSGLVGMGVDAGVGLINALNHNPTVKIPLAWKKATHEITSMMEGTVVSADRMGGGMVGIFRAVGKSIEGSMAAGFTIAAGAAKSFAFTSIFAMFPVGLAAIGIGVIVAAIAMNFLGLKDVAKGAFKVIEGATQIVISVMVGLFQVIKSIGQIVKGVFIGDFNLAYQGFIGIGQAIIGVANGIGSGIKIAFSGAVQAVAGLFSGLGRFIDRVFQILQIEGFTAASVVQRVGSVFGTVARSIQSAIQSPQAAWQGFLATIDKIETKVRSAIQVISQSPVGKFARSNVAAAKGEAVTPTSARLGVDFDDQLGPESPAQNIVAPKLQNFKQRIGNLFNPKAATQAAAQSPAPASSAGQAASSNLSIDKPNSAMIESAVAPLPTAGDPSQAIASVMQVKSAGVNAAMDAGNAVQSILSMIAPGIGGVLGGVMSIVMSFASLATTIPLLVSSFTALGGITGLWGIISTAASTAVATGFGAVTAGAAVMWTAITGPLLPIVAAIAGLALVIGGVFLAVKSNFLGLGTLFSTVYDAVKSTFGELFGIVKSAWDDSVGGIMSQLDQLKQVFVSAFEPLFSMFSGGSSGGGIGGAIQAGLFVATFGFRVLATVVGAVIRVIGNLISGFIVFAQVVTSIVLAPLKAVFQAAGDIGNAFSGLIGAIVEPFKPLMEWTSKFFASFNQGTNESNQAFQAMKMTLEIAFLPLRAVFSILGLAIRGIGFAIVGMIKGFQFLASVILLPVRLIGMMLQGVMFAGDAIRSALIAPFQGVMEFVTGIFNFVMNIPSAIAAGLGAAIQQIQGFLGGVGQQIAGIPVLGSVFSFFTGVQAGPAAPDSQAPQMFAQGGPVNAGSGVADTVRALLTPGEFVMNPQATATYNPILQAMNAGTAGLGAIASFVAGNLGITAPSNAPALKPEPPIFNRPSLPQMVNAFAPTPVLAGAGAGLGPVTINLNVEQIIVGGDSGNGGGSAQSIALEIIDQLGPHLEIAVGELLRSMIDKTR